MNHCKLKAQYIVILALLLILPIGYGIMNPHMVQAAKKTKNSIQKKKITLYVGQSAKLRVIGAKKVKWKSSNKKVASVSSKGTVRAKKKGKATITATVKKQKLKCVVTVKAKKKSNNNSNNTPNNTPTNDPTNDPTNKKPIPATSIQLNKKHCYIEKGGTLSLTATVSPFNTTQTVTWSSDKPSIASVNQRGMVTGLQIGTATIQVKVGNLTDYCIVEIVSANDPSYAFSMPNETEEDCEGVYVSLKNNGNSIMRIYSDLAMLMDYDYAITDVYNRELVLIDYHIYKTEGRIEEVEYIDISPNQTTTLLFLIDGEPTRYKSDTFVYFIFEYDEKLYLHVGSYDLEGTCVEFLNEDADFIYIPLIQ